MLAFDSDLAPIVGQQVTQAIRQVRITARGGTGLLPWLIERSSTHCDCRLPGLKFCKCHLHCAVEFLQRRKLPLEFAEF
jgi:hypothetical protein